MSKLPIFQAIFEHFLSVGKSQAKTQVVFQAETQAKNCSIELGPSNLVVGEFNFGGVVSKQQQGANHKAFKFTAAKSKAVLAEKSTNNKAGSEAAVPVKRPMGYKPHTGKLKDWNELQGGDSIEKFLASIWA